MARPKVQHDDDTVRVCTSMARSERDRLKAAAERFGVPMAEFLRLVLIAAANGATQPVTVISAPDERGRAVPPQVVRPVADVSTAGAGGHTHRAGPQMSGGIHGCIEKGCAARKVAGRWVEVT